MIRISVRNLVEFILRSGDLDNRKGGADKEAMAKGSRLHRKIQKRMGSGYQPEVSLKDVTDYEAFSVCVEGRADGIFQDGEGWAIDEIKGIYKELHTLSEPELVHLAQAKCYAYIYAKQKELTEIRVQMTYCHLDTEDIRRFTQSYTWEELKEWYHGLLEEFYRWADFSWKWKQTRNASMEGLEFPFAYRPRQREIVAGVYGTIARHKQLFVQAPTGIGKTMSAVFPAVRAVGEGKGDKIFYLTAKTITRTVAEEAFALLQEKGLAYKVITITAKEKICPQEEAVCNPDHCPYAKGHFDRINEAVYEILTQKDSYGREILLEHAEKWQVCPFELCLDISTWVDAVICDYNYVFDPNVYLKRFFGDNGKGDYIFLIDEAHNLVDRGRDMYSAALYKEDILQLKRQVKPYSHKLERLLEKVNRCLLEYKRECETYEVLDNTGSLPIHLMNLMGEMEEFLEEPPGEEIQEKVLEGYFAVRNFLNIYDLVDENYVIYTELGEDGRFMLKLFCVNPAHNLQNCLDKGIAAVFFSATLLPLPYYRSLFSTAADDFAISVPSPFEAANRCLLLGRDVSSRYTRRGYEEYRKIAEYIKKVTAVRRGNYMVFFPSHRLMQDVYQVYEDEFEQEGERCLVQQAVMSEDTREEFLDAFAREDGQVTAFCVMGGIFSEGIDLMGERLIGVIVVGTGLPQVSHEREILKNFYDKEGKNGFDYAYRYPGMNKVLQAAGRVIRTDEDRGVILLLDERFGQWEYRQLFPREWEDVSWCTRMDVEKHLENFWKKAENT
ncbi:MAG: ATP-dependent DNA helicase [Blautia sp.]